MDKIKDVQRRIYNITGQRVEELKRADDQQKLELLVTPLISEDYYNIMLDEVIEDANNDLAECVGQFREILPKLAELGNKVNEIVSAANDALGRLQRDLYLYNDCTFWKDKGIVLAEERAEYCGNYADIAHKILDIYEKAGEIEQIIPRG